LRCGESQISLGPKSIEIQSPSIVLKATDALVTAAEGKLKIKAKDKVFVTSKKVALKSEGASLGLSKNALLDGEKVKLNCGPDSEEDKDTEETKKPTVITLKDKDGKPLAHQRFLIKMSDGTEVSGVGDKDGKATLDLDEGGVITFPDLSDYT
jgi:type VI secretion system secreted protein VgrG